MFDRLRRRLFKLAKGADGDPPLPIPGEAEAAGIRNSLAALHSASAERFALRFLRDEPILGEPAERSHLEMLTRAGLLERVGESLHRPTARVFPLEGKFIATDLLSRETEDQVFSLRFEQVFLVRNMDVRPDDDVLELCLGSGVNSLFAADTAGSVTGVDLSDRAAAFARFNAAINEAPASLEIHTGSLFQPVGDRRFDLILVNPPFELAPPGQEWFLHSHGGADGLDVVRDILASAPRHLTPRGRFEIITWSPGSEEGTALLGLLREAFPDGHIEIRPLGLEPLEDHVSQFAGSPGFGEWVGGLREQGIDRADFLFARVTRGGEPGLDTILDEAEIKACYEISDVWM